MHEDVLAAVRRRDEAEALLAVEELYGAGGASAAAASPGASAYVFSNSELEQIFLTSNIFLIKNYFELFSNYF